MMGAGEHRPVAFIHGLYLEITALISYTNLELCIWVSIAFYTFFSIKIMTFP